MKIICTITLVILCACQLLAQGVSIEAMEESLPHKQGDAFIEDALTLSDHYFSQGNYEKAARLADAAYDKAKNLGNDETTAITLHHRGKSMMRVPNSRNNLKNQAYKSFEESNALTRKTSLRLKNLQQMKILATELNKRRDLENVREEIAALSGYAQSAETEKETRKGLFNRRKKELQEKNQYLAEALTELTEEQQALRAQQDTLMNVITRKETAIQDMSEEQMKQELLLTLQERLLDSLTFSSILDSMDLANQNMILQQQESELREQEAALQLQRTQRNLLLALAGAGILITIGLFHRYHVIRKHNTLLEEKNRIIEEERQRSEELLLNILPKAVADELKASGGAETQYFDNATVLFADFKGFSNIAKKLSPKQLVSDLDYAFKNFDAIIGRYGLEKIKTIGDAYMCAGGLPSEDEAHPANVVQAALKMQEFLKIWNAEKAGRGEPQFDARIGIHTGPLVAGVVGSKKFAYDIWGDTVNVASRMETSSEPGRVNISATTFSRVKDQFSFEYRGKVPAKNVGEVEMYFVNEQE